MGGVFAKYSVQVVAWLFSKKSGLFFGISRFKKIDTVTWGRRQWVFPSTQLVFPSSAYCLGACQNIWHGLCICGLPGWKAVHFYNTWHLWNVSVELHSEIRGKPSILQMIPGLKSLPYILASKWKNDLLTLENVHPHPRTRHAMGWKAISSLLSTSWSPQREVYFWDLQIFRPH